MSERLGHDYVQKSILLFSISLDSYLGNKVGDSGAEHLEHGGRVGIEHAHSVSYLIAYFMFCTL